MNQTRKKLIEVALPLDAINAESAREKSIRHGHPSTLHLWWARRPLAACRAVLFASLVDDPSSLPELFPSEEAQHDERERLHDIIKELVLWDNVNNETVLHRARTEIARSCARAAGVTLPAGELSAKQVREALEEYAPPVLDPFAGGGSIPLEAQRLGLKAYASDLNPVAVLINKALIEIPPKFAGRPPVNPEARRQMPVGGWRGAAGLAEDVRYYGKWMRDEAERRIGHLYPKVKLPKEYGGGEATVIAWLWARTVKCPNPACGAEMPLVRSFVLSARKGNEAWVEPLIDKKAATVRFQVKIGKGKAREGTVNRRGARCLVCGTPVPFDHVRAEGRAGRMGVRPMAMIAETARERVYLEATDAATTSSRSIVPAWRPDVPLPHNPRDFKTPNYGMTTFADLFTPRQLVALTTLSDLVGEAREHVRDDALEGGLMESGTPLAQGGCGAQAYAGAVGTYLSFAVDKCADYWNTIATWMPRGTVGHAFSKQALPMTWDFVEANPLAEFHCAWHEAYEWVAKQVALAPPDAAAGVVGQLDAASSLGTIDRPLVSTDPPYYDNIGYADLSDFFYIWLRRSLGQLYPTIFSTLLVPKAQELIASPYRFDGARDRAQQFFEQGLGRAFALIRRTQDAWVPTTIYYAFKQSESQEEENDDGERLDATVASTGWETMLEGLIRAGFAITGTWPMRTERAARSIGLGTNALASSIVLVCRPRSESAALATRREFLNALKREIPDALTKLTHGGVAPVDLAQASIGPGMAVYSRYAKVLEADGTPMGVRTALQIINQQLDEYLAALEGEFDRDTRFALAWFEQYGHDEASFGEADVLARAKDTAVAAIVQGGILHSRAGKVRLLRRDEYPDDWDPRTDVRLTVWECTQQLIRRLNDKGEAGAAALMRQLGAGRSEDARALAYRLFAICERKAWADEALAYNGLVVSWPEIERLSVQREEGEQGTLF